MSLRWSLVLVALEVGCAKKGVQPMAIGIEPPEPPDRTAATPAVAPPSATPAAFDAALGEVHFEFDSALLRLEDQPVMQANLSALNANPEMNVLVIGHTDERGNDAYNLVLGQRRADAVKRWLVKHGVDSARISTASHGEAEPVAAGHDAASWNENRRAVTTIATNAVAAARPERPRPRSTGG